MKRLIGIQGNDQGHWVGNGFPVRTLFFYQQLGKEMSPFLMLDLAGPAEFPATAERKGVGTHPHRGFETVTIVYEGEVSHKDSTGQRCSVDDCWGRHSSSRISFRRFCKTGGRFANGSAVG
jgi:redox-sensitive bicupin YhaK (pirin superfamily)